MSRSPNHVKTVNPACRGKVNQALMGAAMRHSGHRRVLLDAGAG
jgi:hypothetical protein